MTTISTTLLWKIPKHHENVCGLWLRIYALPIISVSLNLIESMTSFVGILSFNIHIFCYSFEYGTVFVEIFAIASCNTMESEPPWRRWKHATSKLEITITREFTQAKRGVIIEASYLYFTFIDLRHKGGVFCIMGWWWRRGWRKRRGRLWFRRFSRSWSANLSYAWSLLQWN